MKKKQRIGILCGTFDPVRLGQIREALRLLSRGKYDRLLLMPSGHPCMAPAEDRWRMLVSACAYDDRLIPSRFCIDNAADADDAALLPALQALYPDAKLTLLPSLPSFFSAGAVQEDLDIPVLEYCRCKGLYGFPGKLDHIGEWMDRLFPALKPKRFAHSLSVAFASKQLAVVHGISGLQAEQAGLLHDCAKCLPLPEMQRIALEHALTEDQTVLSSGALLHSLAGAWIAEHIYGMKDPAVLEAIRYHNTGSPGMSRLAMCVCLADSIEPLRESYPQLDHIRAVSLVNLEEALLLSLQATADYVISRGKYLHPSTRDTIVWLRSLVRNRQ